MDPRRNCSFATEVNLPCYISTYRNCCTEGPNRDLDASTRHRENTKKHRTGKYGFQNASNIIKPLSFRQQDKIYLKGSRMLFKRLHIMQIESIFKILIKISKRLK